MFLRSIKNISADIKNIFPEGKGYVNRTSYNTFELLKWVGIFQLGISWVTIFRGEFTRGEFDGWEFSGWAFSREGIFLQPVKAKIKLRPFFLQISR